MSFILISSYFSPYLALDLILTPIFYIGFICSNSDLKTWDNHRATAQASSGGDLVTIHCREQNAKVNTLVGSADVYIGANDKDSEGTWKWVADETTVPLSAEDGYENWNNGEPNDAGGAEDCGVRFGSTGVWNDVPCTNNLPAVYESATDEDFSTCIKYVGK